MKPLFSYKLFQFYLPGVLIAFGTGPLVAQDAAEEETKVFVLDPFEVQVSRDEGFVAATSLAGGRMSTDLSETAAAYSVQTREFLEALNINDANEALDWTVNATTTPDAGESQLFGGTGSSTIRGVRSNSQHRDFFRGGSNAASYNVERLDYARGPNAVLFGTGTISGTSNVVVKRAQLGTDFTEVRIQVGSWGAYRTDIDVNRKLGSNAAVRITGVYEDTPSWRDNWLTKRHGIAPGFSYRFSNRTRLTVLSDFYRQEVTRGMTSMLDNFSGWDGVTTYAGIQPNTSQFQFGASRYFGKTYIWSPASGAGANTLINHEGQMRTQGYQGQRPLNGALPLINSNLGLDRAPIIDNLFQPEGIFDAAIAGSAFRIPSRSFTNIGPVPTSYNTFGTGTFYLDHRLGDSLTIQLSGNLNHDREYGLINFYGVAGNFAQQNSFPWVSIDINELLWDGRPNPNFLKPYNEIAEPARQYVDTDNQTFRLALAYEDEFDWIEIAGNVILAHEEEVQFRSREYYMLDHDPDPRQWGLATSEKALSMRYRYYWDQEDLSLPEFDEISVIDPVTGQTRTYNPLWTLASDRTEGTLKARGVTQYAQASTSLAFFKRKLILFGAYRYDHVKRSQKQFDAPMDHPEGTVLTRNNFIFRPDAPKDYATLSYIPKNTAGNQIDLERPAITRPRDAYGQALPQYANDRFQDDFNPPSITDKVGTGAVGAIVNVGRGFSLWLNHAETFNPAQLGKTTIDYYTPESSVSVGTDIGIRYSLGPKLSLSLSRYQSREKNAGIDQPSGYSSINEILQANVLGDVSYNGRNIRGLDDRPPFWQDVIDREAEGWEFELTANPMEGLRVIVNFGTADASQVNAYRQTRNWVDANDATLRLILDDAGVQIDADGMASLKPNLDQQSVDGQRAANAWNRLQASRENWITGRQSLRRNTDWTANFYIDYRFRDTFLKGLRVGYGMQFRGPQVVGWRGADTMVDPDNPNAAIDNPDVDATTSVYRDSYYTARLTIGYPINLKKGQIYLNLSIDNLFDHDEPIYYNARLRPENGDITSPARVTYVDGHYYLNPINFRLSVKYTF